MSKSLIKFTNCTVLRDHKLIREDLWVRDGKIVDPQPIFYEEKVMPDKVFNLKNKVVAPGFIDIQINGGFGYDFTHNFHTIESSIQEVAKGILSHGVTAFCPTVVTSKPHIYKEVIPRICKQKGGLHGAEVLGVHVEGPFISAKKKGAHSETEIIEFDKGVQTLDEVYGVIDNVKIVTLAPEKKNAMEVITHLSSSNIVPSLGHSEADFSQGIQAVKKGARLITHLFNAMLPFHHRDPGLVGLLSAQTTNPIYYGIIADGVHTHPAALRIAFKTHPKGAIIVTDAISAMGLMEGTHHLGDKSIDVRGNKAFISGTETLCGSVTTMDRCVETFFTSTGCSLIEALEAASLHPANALNLQGRKGTLNFGADADFVVVDENIIVYSTWIAGECVFSRTKEQ